MTMTIDRALAILLFCSVLAGPGRPAAAAGAAADWPCVQPRVATVSAATMWAGPPLDAAEASWRDDAEVEALAGRLASRGLGLDEAQAAIGRFADSLPAADRALRLSRLFVATLHAVNRDRSQMLDGIGRYARRQDMLAHRITERAGEIRALEAGADTEERRARRTELEEAQRWDSRVLDERQHSLRYLCEQPVLAEQRAFAIAREIQARLD